jgi:peroxiredoxin
VHNYPWYRGWVKEFQDDDFVVVGIHTPETARERVVEDVKAKVKEEDLTFPILIDNDKKNWTAWGNTMWPTVYLIDKDGYVRTWWMGELNWKGAGAQNMMRDRIKKMLAE